VYLAAGLTATGLYFLLPWNCKGQWMLYELIGASSCVAVVGGARRHLPHVSAAWYMFAACLLAFSVCVVLFIF
jgi:hypothetical protein